MNEQVKRAVDSIDVPRGQVRSHLLAGVQQARRPRFVGRKIATGLVAALLLTVGGGMLLEETPPATEIVRTDGAVVVPNWAQDEQVDGDSTAGSMLPGLVYKQELYLAMETPLTDDVRTLQGERLERVTATLEETGDDVIENASNLGPVTLYRVDGYKPSVRLFAVGEEEGRKKVWLLERQTGFTVTTGNDFFKDLHLDQPVKHFAYQTFDEWNDAETARPVTVDRPYRAFLNALYQSDAMIREEVPKEAADYMHSDTMKVLRVTQADGITVSLRLIAGGYVVYPQLDVFFKVNPVAFKVMWEAL